MPATSTDPEFIYRSDKGYFDLEVSDGELASGSDLQTAVGISLFTDARSSNDDRIPNARGGAMDTIRGDGLPSLGSKIWLAGQKIIESETPQQVRQYAIDALRWLTSFGIAESYEIDAQILNLQNGAIGIDVQIFRPQDARPTTYSFTWSQLGQ